MSLALAAPRAGEEPKDPVALDLVFAVDASLSTQNPSGADIDGNGRTARPGLLLNLLPSSFVGKPDFGDSILAAELRAIRAALERLDARTTRVGLIAYSGKQGDATLGSEVLAPLAREYDRVRAALDAVAARGPQGLTDLRGGVELARLELEDAPADDPATAENHTQRVIILFGDGRPNLPYRGDTAANRRESVAAAQRLHARVCGFLAYGIGPALFEPLLREIADASGGRYTRVEDAAQIDLVAGLESLAP